MPHPSSSWVRESRVCLSLTMFLRCSIVGKHNHQVSVNTVRQRSLFTEGIHDTAGEKRLQNHLIRGTRGKLNLDSPPFQGCCHSFEALYNPFFMAFESGAMRERGPLRGPENLVAATRVAKAQS